MAFWQMLVLWLLLPLLCLSGSIYEEDYYRECAPWHSHDEKDSEGGPPRKVLFVNLPTMQELYGKEDNGEADFMLSYDDISKVMEGLLVMDDDDDDNDDDKKDDGEWPLAPPVAYEHYMAASLDYAIRQSGYTVERISINDKEEANTEWLQQLHLEQYHRVIFSHYLFFFLSEDLIQLYPHEISCRVRTIHWYGNWQFADEDEGDEGENNDGSDGNDNGNDDNDNNDNDDGNDDNDGNDNDNNDGGDDNDNNDDANDSDNTDDANDGDNNNDANYSDNNDEDEGKEDNDASDTNDENDDNGSIDASHEDDNGTEKEARKLHSKNPLAERVHNKQMLTPYSESYNTFMGFFLHHLLLPPPPPEELEKVFSDKTKQRAGLVLLGTSCPANQALDPSLTAQFGPLIRSLVVSDNNADNDDDEAVRLDVACHRGDGPEPFLLFCPLTATFDEDGVHVGSPLFSSSPSSSSSQARLWHILATQQWSFVLGLGKLPVLSPLPLLFLSWGVAFLNPLLTSHNSDNDDNNDDDPWKVFSLDSYHAPNYRDEQYRLSGRATEHDAISLLGPPYVYRVRLNDADADDDNKDPDDDRVASSVQQAIQWSLQFPFFSFVPWEFRVDAAITRACALLEDDGVCQCEPNTYVAQDDSDEMVLVDCHASWYVRKFD